MTSLNIVAVVGNTSARSRTKVLAETIVGALTRALDERVHLRLQVLEIADLAPHIGTALAPSQLGAEGAAAIRAIETADLIVAVTPVHKGSYSGLFKHLFDLVDHEALVGRPILLAANGGSHRHALVVDHQLRPLFAFFRALAVPSAIYAAEADYVDYTIEPGPLRERIDEAVAQAVTLLLARQSVPDLRLIA
jgi:FMN reductase